MKSAQKEKNFDLVSAFVCDCHGVFSFSSNLTELNLIILLVHKDGYFTNDGLTKQIKKMLKIFNVLHPGCVALVVYGNSWKHYAMAKDTLVAN